MSESPFLWTGNHPATDLCNTESVIDGERVELLPDFDAVVSWANLANVQSDAESFDVTGREAERTLRFVHHLRAGMRAVLDPTTVDPDRYTASMRSCARRPGSCTPNPGLGVTPCRWRQLRLAHSCDSTSQRQRWTSSATIPAASGGAQAPRASSCSWTSARAGAAGGATWRSAATAPRSQSCTLQRRRSHVVARTRGSLARSRVAGRSRRSRSPAQSLAGGPHRHGCQAWHRRPPWPSHRQS